MAVEDSDSCYQPLAAKWPKKSFSATGPPAVNSCWCAVTTTLTTPSTISCLNDIATNFKSSWTQNAASFSIQYVNPPLLSGCWLIFIYVHGIYHGRVWCLYFQVCCSLPFSLQITEYLGSGLSWHNDSYIHHHCIFPISGLYRVRDSMGPGCNLFGLLRYLLLHYEENNWIILFGTQCSQECIKPHGFNASILGRYAIMPPIPASFR